jgi:hypothetical protein
VFGEQLPAHIFGFNIIPINEQDIPDAFPDNGSGEEPCEVASQKTARTTAPSQYQMELRAANLGRFLWQDSL